MKKYRKQFKDPNTNKINFDEKTEIKIDYLIPCLDPDISENESTSDRVNFQTQLIQQI